MSRVLMIQVMMKDLVTPVAVDEIRNVVRKCLENAALINYSKILETARNDGKTRPVDRQTACLARLR